MALRFTRQDSIHNDISATQEFILLAIQYQSVGLKVEICRRFNVMIIIASWFLSSFFVSPRRTWIYSFFLKKNVQQHQINFVFIPHRRIRHRQNRVDIRDLFFFSSNCLANNVFRKMFFIRWISVINEHLLRVSKSFQITKIKKRKPTTSTLGDCHELCLILS